MSESVEWPLCSAVFTCAGRGALSLVINVEPVLNRAKCAGSSGQWWSGVAQLGASGFGSLRKGRSRHQSGLQVSQVRRLD